MRRPMHAFTSADYYRMWDAGVLTPDDEIELLCGLLVIRYARSVEHERVRLRLRNELSSRFSGFPVSARLDCHLTLDSSVPSPDLLMVRAESEQASRVTADNVALVVEVADASLEVDRLDKIPMYARHGIPVYWIVNLVDRQIEVYEHPTGASPSPTYGTQRQYKPGDAVPLVLSGTALGTVPVTDLLP